MTADEIVNFLTNPKTFVYKSNDIDEDYYFLYNSSDKPLMDADIIYRGKHSCLYLYNSFSEFEEYHSTELIDKMSIFAEIKEIRMNKYV